MKYSLKTFLLLIFPLLLLGQNNAIPIQTLLIKGKACWNKTREIKSDVIISSKANLTITANIQFAETAKIIIKPGGKLFLDGGLLTNRIEDKRWQGIEVQGNPNSPDPNDQGLLVMNNATIENAVVGVRNYFASEMLNYGGIVHATSSHFINNQKAVQLSTTHYDLSNNYYTYFDNCDFEVNEDYQGATSFKYFANLNLVNDVIFKNCDFIVTQYHQGTGIQAKNASFLVNTCHFENLGYGIQNYASGSDLGSKITQSTFTNNYRGIYISGVNEMEINHNTISVSSPDDPGLKSHGIYLDRCDGYSVEDNTFTSYNAGNKGTVGLYIKNSGKANNQVYNNIFENLNYGAIAYGRNRHPDEPGGLCFKCNDFTNNNYDISVYGENLGDGISASQGSNVNEATAPAGNRFSNTPNSVGLDNQADHFAYWIPKGLQETDFYPNSYSINVTIMENQYQLWTYEDNCPPSGGGNGGGITTETERSAMASNQAEADNTQSILDLLVDGGDTQGTTQEVETAYPPETYSVYNELMNKSPYLSDEVVKASIEKEEVLPNVMIRDIMVANPQSAKEKELMDKVDERANPMPDYMKAQILAGKDIVGYMEELEAKKAHYTQQRAIAFHNLIRLYQQDTLLSREAKIDTLLVLFAQENTLEAQYRRAMLYFAKEEYSSGQNILSAIPNTFTLDAEQTTEHSYMQDFYQIAMDLAINNSPITAQQISDLEYIVQEEAGLSEVYARNLLIAQGVLDYTEEVIIPGTTLFAAHPQEETLQEALETHSYMSLFPNPAKDYLIVSYELEMEYSDAQLQIYDAQGRLLKTIAAENIQDQKVISTTDFKAGTYVIRLSFNGKEMEKKKFTVINK